MVSSPFAGGGQNSTGGATRTDRQCVLSTDPSASTVSPGGCPLTAKNRLLAASYVKSPAPTSPLALCSIPSSRGRSLARTAQRTVTNRLQVAEIRGENGGSVRLQRRNQAGWSK